MKTKKEVVLSIIFGSLFIVFLLLFLGVVFWRFYPETPLKGVIIKKHCITERCQTGVDKAAWVVNQVGDSVLVYFKEEKERVKECIVSVVEQDGDTLNISCTLSYYLLKSKGDTVIYKTGKYFGAKAVAQE